MNEYSFIEKLKAGDATAYKDLIKEFGGKIYNTTLGMLQNEEDAEDCTQDVFVEIFQSVRQFKGESKLSTWIYRIAVTKSLESIRKKNRKKRFAVLYRIFPQGDDLPPIEIPDFIHPGVLLENKERSAILFSAINKLPENQKTAFVLHKIEDLSYAEICEVMQLSLSSIESLMFRAKQNLQKLLKNYYNRPILPKNKK